MIFIGSFQYSTPTVSLLILRVIHRSFNLSISIHNLNSFVNHIGLVKFHSRNFHSLNFQDSIVVCVQFFISVLLQLSPSNLPLILGHNSVILFLNIISIDKGESIFLFTMKTSQFFIISASLSQILFIALSLRSSIVSQFFGFIFFSAEFFNFSSASFFCFSSASFFNFSSASFFNLASASFFNLASFLLILVPLISLNPCKIELISACETHISLPLLFRYVSNSPL
ncbi:MAG: hypothetical protein WCG25_07155 [bacterium]